MDKLLTLLLYKRELYKEKERGAASNKDYQQAHLYLVRASEIDEVILNIDRIVKES